jgi:hypothetical protein
VTLTSSSVAAVICVTPLTFSSWIALSLPAAGVPDSTPPVTAQVPVLDAGTDVSMVPALALKSSVRVTVAAGGTTCTAMLSIAPRDLFEPKPTRPQFRP